MMETATYPVEYTTMASSSWRARLRQFPAHTAYLIGGFPLALVSFILGVTLFAAGAGTAIIFIGLSILAAGLLTAGGFAALERRLAEKATGRAMPDPAYHRLGDDAPPLKRLGATLRDPQRWFDLLWVLVHFVLATSLQTQKPHERVTALRKIFLFFSFFHPLTDTGGGSRFHPRHSHS